MYHEHDAGRFTTWFLKKFGQEAYENLYFKYNTTSKITNPELVLLIKHYEEML